MHCFYEAAPPSSAPKSLKRSKSHPWGDDLPDSGGRFRLSGRSSEWSERPRTVDDWEPSAEDFVQRAALAQNADGSWDFVTQLTRLVYRLTGAWDREFIEYYYTHVEETRMSRRTVATAIVLAALEIKCSEIRQEGELMAEKARKWLRAHGVPHPEGKDWQTEARKALGG